MVAGDRGYNSRTWQLVSHTLVLAREMTAEHAETPTRQFSMEVHMHVEYGTNPHPKTSREYSELLAHPRSTCQEHGGGANAETQRSA